MSEDKSALKVQTLVADSEPRSTFGECVQSALKLASNLWANVHFNYDGKTFRVNVDDLAQQVHEL